jgi:hypothetical protein
MAIEEVPEHERRIGNGDIRSARDVGMSRGITFTERYDEDMTGSNGECGTEDLGDIETKGRIDQVGNCSNDWRVPI